MDLPHLFPAQLLAVCLDKQRLHYILREGLEEESIIISGKGFLDFGGKVGEGIKPFMRVKSKSWGWCHWWTEQTKWVFYEEIRVGVGEHCGEQSIWEDETFLSMALELMNTGVRWRREKIMVSNVCERCYIPSSSWRTGFYEQRTSLLGVSLLGDWMCQGEWRVTWRHRLIILAFVFA